MDLINLVYNTLSPLNVPILWQLRPTTLPGITYHFFDESGELFGEGQETLSMTSCQIDIWSKDNYTDLKKNVRKIMKSNGFLFANGFDSFEADVNIYHKTLVFNYYYESEVMECQQILRKQ
ncbi:hypothetical protein [uncultured Clostridium sp.]|uniref:hypothetical protein n=1 Tax=uncultured Clostridium sp. TaxID=59620 RepID=UPI0028EBF4DE|nr:hypothetical protein [uncultured Clostridium sp.]